VVPFVTVFLPYISQLLLTRNVDRCAYADQNQVILFYGNVARTFIASIIAKKFRLCCSNRARHISSFPCEARGTDPTSDDGWRTGEGGDAPDSSSPAILTNLSRRHEINTWFYCAIVI
jgi:hypothetical protein